MSSIYEGYSASLVALSLLVSLGAYGCSSASNSSSATIGGNAATGGSHSSASSGGSSASSVTSSNTATGGGSTGGIQSTGGSTTSSSVQATGGAQATGGSSVIGTTAVPASGGTSSSSSISKATGGAGGMATSGLGGTRNGTSIGGQGGTSFTKSTGGVTGTGTASGGRAAGGGAGQAGSSVTNGGTSAGGRNGTASDFQLTSSELVDGGIIPTDATCESPAATSQLPPLAWAGAPAGTKSFAMVFVDVTLIRATPPNTNGFHSAMWDIPATVDSLPKGLPAGSPPAGIAGLETVKQKKAPSGEAYLGPCPNFPNTTRTKTDTYEFRLYALDVATLPSSTSSMSVQQIYNYLEGLPPLGVAVLAGTSNAAGTKLK